VITAAALCPHPPLLFRELTGQQDVAAELRAACVDVVRRATEGCDLVVVVGGADRSGPWDPSLAPDVRPFGTTGRRVVPAGLPLSLGVGRRLLDDAGWTGPVEPAAVAWDAGREEVDGIAAELVARPGPVALLVLGEGSTRRGQTAPGFLDPRAFPFDDALAAAVGAGDAQALAGLDPVLAGELMVLGRAAFGVLGACALAAGAEVRPALTYRDDPFGVSYLVALWSFA